MGRFKYIPTKRVVQLARFMPKSVQQYILESKYIDKLQSQYFASMKAPKTENDKKLRERAYKRFTKEKDKRFSSIEHKIQFRFSLNGYAKEFAEYDIRAKHLNVNELEDLLIPSRKRERTINQNTPNKPILPEPEKERLDNSAIEKPLTKEDIIKNKGYSIDRYKEDLNQEFNAVYAEMPDNRKRMEKQWREELKNESDPFFKMRYQEFLKKAHLFKARNLKMKKREPRDNDLEL